MWNIICIYNLDNDCDIFVIFVSSQIHFMLPFQGASFIGCFVSPGRCHWARICCHFVAEILIIILSFVFHFMLPFQGESFIGHFVSPGRCHWARICCHFVAEILSILIHFQTPLPILHFHYSPHRPVVLSPLRSILVNLRTVWLRVHFLYHRWLRIDRIRIGAPLIGNTGNGVSGGGFQIRRNFQLIWTG